MGPKTEIESDPLPHPRRAWGQLIFGAERSLEGTSRTEHLHWTTEIVAHAHNDAHQQWVLIDGEPVLVRKPRGGFQVQRKRWIVERSFSWIVRWRRLARDHEGLPESSETFITFSACYRLLTRLAPALPSRWE